MEKRVQFACQGRRESYLINDSLLEFEHKKFQNALDDQLLFEQDDTDEVRRLTFRTLENVTRGDLPKGSHLFQKVMDDLQTKGKDVGESRRKHRTKSASENLHTVRFQKQILKRTYTCMNKQLP
ncbi:hypothetical protein KP79_PYT08438 [Mizuhopecten yessoensis]|uniref:Uncharacterized protein n=1 Tax=Mizuhopecten yessoensis TaxID=6573 RepID=A0A210QYF2_MIZYE|nr:hypothetical protein KP79_PYT08438 [Mizuhopecten yessoensis]